MRDDNYARLKRDTRDQFYVDRENGSFGVFGTESGFCYALYSDRGEAERDAQRRTEQRGP
jgi:hypothetical protein